MSTSPRTVVPESDNGALETTNNNLNGAKEDTHQSLIVREGVRQEISKQVLRQKLGKFRHLVIPKGIHSEYLESLFPQLLQHFDPQTVYYNGGIANVPEWKISCYLEVMEGGVPCTNPNLPLLELFQPLLEECNSLFLEWYRQQHACNQKGNNRVQRSCRRLMTFVTRYTPKPGEQALLKHVDGAGKVDGSLVVALPMDRWSGPEEENSFEGHGGGLTVWDGKDYSTKRPVELHYETRSGDLAFMDRAVWHQADPITKGVRWALVIFYQVQNETTE
eukprot:Nitzschia sp. Nitz4//scaffold225_size51843//30328//31383//NITZ4_006898-RA/size51843-snap-gene-0.3-mRNA-1//1//CDS//3329542684//1432//frame0